MSGNIFKQTVMLIELFLDHAKYGHHMKLLIDGYAVIDLAVHMNGKIWYNTDRFLQINIAYFRMKNILAAQGDLAGNGQRTVEKCA